MDRRATLLAMLEKTPGDAFLQHALALEHIKAGEDASARQMFERLLEQHPGYVGSYYHLAKLLEGTGETKLALSWYQRGITAARSAQDHHALGELQAAYDNLEES